MSIKTHVRYILTCDKCGYFYFNVFDDSKVLVSHAKSDGWDISDNGHSCVCICPDCKRKEDAE